MVIHVFVAAGDFGQNMESSRRFLLQAEIEYWHEMLRLNGPHLDSKNLKEMRDCLRQAVRNLNSNSFESFEAAA